MMVGRGEVDAYDFSNNGLGLVAPQSCTVTETLSGEFPRLLPGRNAISWMGNVASLAIAPNWRSL